MTTRRKLPGSKEAPERTESLDWIMGARLARQLGISATTFWRWRKTAGFPTGRRIRNHVYFSRSDVQAWIDSQQATV